MLKEKGLDGLVPTHGEILMSLHKTPYCKMNELANSIRRKKNTVTTLVRKLEEKRYVETTRSLDDSRVTLVSITEEGEKIRNEFKEILDLVTEKFWSNTKEKKKNSLMERLGSHLDNLEE